MAGKKHDLGAKVTFDSDAVLERDPETWDQLLARLNGGEHCEVPGFVLALKRDGLDDWEEFVRERLEASDQFFMTSGPLNKFRAWAAEQLVAALEPADPLQRATRWRMIATIAADDGGFAAAQGLFDDCVEHGTDQEVAEAALLLAKGAFTVRDYHAALRAAIVAVTKFRDLQAFDRLNFAMRRAAAAKLYLDDVDGAFTMFDAALKSSGPLFGGGGVQVFQSAPDPKSEAIDEVRDIAAWATSTTPEWVRAVGGLAERWDDAAVSAKLWQRFDAAVASMCTGSNSESDIEVVVRHARQREMHEVAGRALDAFVAQHPENLWARELVAEMELQRQFAAAELLFSDDPSAAIETWMSVFERLRDDELLGETTLGHDVCDRLVEAFLERGDERAVEVQRALWDEKLNAWGECPAASLEEQNLGATYAQLGDVAKGKALIQSGLAKLEHQLGPDHPHLLTARRNAERFN